jgi:hypothetical protein
MSNTTIANELEQLKENYEKQVAEKLGRAKELIKEKLTELVDLIHALPESSRKEVFEKRPNSTLLAKLGLKEPAKRKKRRTRKASLQKVSDDEILAYVQTEKTTKQIQDKFNFSSVTVAKRTKQLKSEGKITFRKKSTSKLWKKV